MIIKNRDICRITCTSMKYTLCDYLNHNIKGILMRSINLFFNEDLNQSDNN